jgi:hypothetical protein
LILLIWFKHGFKVPLDFQLLFAPCTRAQRFSLTNFRIGAGIARLRSRQKEQTANKRNQGRNAAWQCRQQLPDERMCSSVAMCGPRVVRVRNSHGCLRK